MIDNKIEIKIYAKSKFQTIVEIKESIIGTRSEI